MRLRNIPTADAIIASSPLCITPSPECKGNWNQFFSKKQTIQLEIGMGKGQFLTSLAKQHPQINFIGFERYSSVLLRGIQKMEAQVDPPDNLRFVCLDARILPDIFAPGEVDGIYLNFSDPWPKERHAKRRLTSRQFLSRYETILIPGGRIEFKTDNETLFDFSLEELSASGWTLETVTRDLHKDSQLMRSNIMTEYEEKFSELGNPIYKFIAYK
ncbi:MAG: tRNA (guanosine(46)-N7)-methyltransferase TrmB [Lachnospiraceae bacterium]